MKHPFHQTAIVLAVAMPLVVLIPLSVNAANSPVQQLFDEYRNQGVSKFSAEQGQALWQKTVDGRRCGSCHTADPRAEGKHQKTKKPIAALAPSINPKRLQKTKTIRKWLKRNCKWTLGRECSAQEKGNFLTWLSQQ